MPAKPYQGTAQTQAVIGLLKRTTSGIRYRASSDYGYYNTGRVRTASVRSGSIYAPEAGLPERTNLGKHTAVNVSLSTGSDTDVETANAPVAALIAELEAEGYDVIRRINGEGRVYQLVVVGPGWREWIARSAQSAAESEVRARDNRAKAEADKEELRELLSAYGIERVIVEAHWNLGTATVKLDLAKVQALILAVKDFTKAGTL